MAGTPGNGAGTRVRIATLLPSATEIVSALGLGEQLVGVSHSCSFPASVSGLPRLTSTRVPYQADSETIDTFVRTHLEGNEALYDLDLKKLADARPDVVISQALCDVCAVATGDVTDAICSLPGAPELIDLTPNTLDDVLDDIRRVGLALDAGCNAETLLDELEARRDAVSRRAAGIAEQDRHRVAFLEWLMPPFNGGHWNPELVTLAGAVDLLGAAGRPSSTLEWQQVVDADPDVLFIAGCGFPVERMMLDIEQVADGRPWRNLRAVGDGRVFVADGDFYSCPGPRLLDGLEIMAHALYPDVHPVADAGRAVQLKPQR